MTNAKTKLPYYAAALIPEVWIQDVNEDVVYVFREPQGKAHKASMKLKGGDPISPLAFPDIRFLDGRPCRPVRPLIQSIFDNVSV